MKAQRTIGITVWTDNGLDWNFEVTIDGEEYASGVSNTQLSATQEAQHYAFMELMR